MSKTTAIKTHTKKETFTLRGLGKGLALGIVAGLGLLASSTPARATDSGLGFYPTADIYPSGNFHFDVDTFGRGLRTDLSTSIGLEYGFGKEHDGLFGRNEIGFDYLTSSGISADDRISFNFKTQLYNNSENGTRISAGIANLGSRVTFTSVDARLLAYKTFNFGRIHAGLWRSFGRVSGVGDTGGLQLGYDRSLGKNVIIGADWRSGPTGFLAPCIIYNINDKAGIEVAIGRANNSAVSPRYQTYIAFDYNFDFKRNDAGLVNPPNLETAPGTANPGPNP